MEQKHSTTGTTLVVVDGVERGREASCEGSEALPAVEESETLKRIRINKRTILDAMANAGIKSVVMTYEGNGDEGQFNDISIEGGNDLASNVTVELVVDTSVFDLENRQWHHSNKVVSKDFVDALEVFVEDLIEQYHSGYESGDGGGGSVTMSSESDTVTYDKYDYVVESAHVEIEV